jgi:hypothetical protein
MSLVPRPYLPRVLACLVVGLLASLTVFIPSGEDDHKQHLYITTPGPTGDIERVIKSLGRTDIEIRHGGTGPFQMDVFEGWIFVFVLGTVISALGWAGISFIFAIIRNLFESKAAK